MPRGNTNLKQGNSCSCFPFPTHSTVGPGDYTPISSQPVTFSSSPSQICIIPISISNDNVVEATEFFTVTLEAADPTDQFQFTQQSAEVSIIDSTSKYFMSVCSIVEIIGTALGKSNSLQFMPMEGKLSEVTGLRLWVGCGK